MDPWRTVHWLIPTGDTALTEIITKRRNEELDRRRAIGLADTYLTALPTISKMVEFLRDEIVPQLIWDPDVYVIMVLPGGLPGHCAEMQDMTRYLVELADDQRIQKSRIIGIVPEHGLYPQAGKYSTTLKKDIDTWCIRALNRAGRIKFIRTRQACPNLGKKNIPPTRMEEVAKGKHHHGVHYWDYEKHQTERSANHTCENCRTKYGKHPKGCPEIANDLIRKMEEINQRKKEAREAEIEDTSSSEDEHFEDMTEASLSDLETEGNQAEGNQADASPPEIGGKRKKRHATSGATDRHTAGYEDELLLPPISLKATANRTKSEEALSTKSRPMGVIPPEGRHNDGEGALRV